MAFGLLVTKFQIFRKPLRVKLENANKLVLSCFLLHNFIIDERLLIDPDYLIGREETKSFDESKLGFLPSDPTLEEAPFLPNVIRFPSRKNLITKTTNNTQRNFIVQKIKEYGFKIPSNIFERRLSENYYK